MAENIINRNLDNITNVAKGLDKEMLDMTYPDKYYKDVINPAKLGQGPIPSKTQMMYQNLKSGGPFKAMRIGMDPYLPSFMGGGKYGAERAMPTGPARTALGAGSGILRTAASLPMQAVMAGPYAISQAMGPSVAAGDFINDEQFQLGQSEVGVGDFYSGKTNLLSDAEKAMMADQYDVGYSFADNERITPNIPSNVPSNFVDTGRDFSMFDQARMGDAVSGTNVQGMDLEMDPAAQQGFLNPNIQPSQNMFQRAGNFINDLDLEEYLPFIGERSLTGMMGRGIGNLFQNIAPARYGTSQRAYNALSPQGRSAVGSIYGPGGIMSGYNAVSAFGRGPMGAIDNRIGNIYNRRAPQTPASQRTIQDLYKAREKIMQTTLDRDDEYTGPTSSPRGQTPGVMDDDPFATGPSETTGGSSKIVCTMMNDSYGFGNFRNKIWLKHSRDLPKEYEIGYHTIFLPLVKFAKGEGKLNKVVKKTLEHIARHRTLDLKQEMKGKTHTLGRVYRKILEPICFLVGKASMFVRRK